MIAESQTSQEVLTALGELHTLFPHWRIGQLVSNVVLAAGQSGEGDVWDIDDEALLAAARRLIARNQTRLISEPD